MPVISKLYRLPQVRQQKPVDMMQTKYEQKYNPKRYRISETARARLKWIDILEQECEGNLSKAGKKFGVSREWITKIYNLWLRSGEDPRKLEPKSKTPQDISNRKRISQTTLDKIINLRTKYPAWGKEKLARLLWTEHNIKVGHTTVNRYLSKAKLLNVRISNKNRLVP